jgi:hypothetical protein
MPVLESQTPDIIKAVILLFLYGFVAPLAGLLMRNSQKAQRAAFAVMCFMTIGGIMNHMELGLTLSPFLYRSHARGYHFYFIVLPALALIFAQAFSRWKEVKLLPPGFWLFYVFCFSASFSIFFAEYPTYVLMAAFKTVELSVIGIASYNFIRTDKDLKFLLNCMAWTIAWQLVVILKQKYIHGVYQVYGTFEHQNSLSTFTTMIGLVFLGAALGPKESKSNWFLWAFIFAAVIVQSSLSRGSLAMFALGTIVVIVMGMFDAITKRRVYVLSALTFVGVVGLAFTMDTIMARFGDYGNEESKRTRDMLEQAAWSMVKDHPMGVGWNNFGRMINHPFHYGDHIDAWQRANGNPVDPNYQKGISESLYHLTMAESGYITVVILVAFFALFLWYNVRAAMLFRSDFIGGFSVGLFGGCSVIYVQSILERVLTQPKNMALWFLLLGAAARIETWRRQELAFRREEASRPTQFDQDQLASLSQPADYAESPR